MSWEDIIKNYRSDRVNPYFANTPIRIQAQPRDSEREDLMKNWNQTIAKIQDMFDSLKTHPIFDDDNYGREMTNQDIDSIKSQIAKKLTFMFE